MSIIAPKFVMLDTATLGAIAAEPTAPLPSELLAILRTGDWVPYLTWHHLEELISHGSDEVFRSRVDLLSRLPHLAYLQQVGHRSSEPYGGSVVDLLHYEIADLITHPGASHQDVIDAIWPFIRGGFVSGEQFVRTNIDWWQIYRRDFAEPRRLLKEQVANLTHFPPTDLKEALPPVGQQETFVSEETSASLRKQMATTLAASITQSGDVRHLNPAALADDFAAAVFEMSSQLRSAGPFFTDAWLHRAGVSRDRLPSSPTIEDVGYEVLFVEQMRVTAAGFSVFQVPLAAHLRKEQIPSWVVWEQVHRRMKQLPRAEIGNVNDQHIVGFGLYVDVLNVDKRIAELLRQAGGHHALLQQVYRRVPLDRGLAGLIQRLKQRSRPRLVPRWGIFLSPCFILHLGAVSDGYPPLLAAARLRSVEHCGVVDHSFHGASPVVADKHPIRRPNIGRNKIPLVRADAADGWPAPESANNCESGAPSVGPVAVTIGKAAVASS